jgi:transposase
MFRRKITPLSSIDASNGDDIRACTGHGTLSLYVALDVKTGRVHGKTAKRHTSEDFLAFIMQIVERTPASKEIHIVLDNLSAHETKSVAEFLEENLRVRFHFMPTYSSWLNQVKIWFAKIQRDVIHRGVFISVADLSRKLMKYIDSTENPPNRSAGPIQTSAAESGKSMTGTAH